MDIHKSKRPSLGSSKETSIDQKVSACTAAPRTPCINIPTHCFSMTGARMVVFSPTSLCGVLVFDSVSGRRLCLLRLLHFVNHQLCHTQLCQPPSFTHNFHHLCHTPSLSWHLWHWAGSGGARGTLRGRRGTWSHPPSFHVAGVALGDIHLRFAWQAWHLWHWAGSGGALGLD